MSVAAPAAPALTFAVTGARAVEHVAVPTIAFDLAVAAAGGAAIRSVLLDVQVQIAARRRPYGPEAHERLFELFGPPGGWGTTLRTLLWTRQTLVVPPFTASTSVQLHLACTYDLEVSAARYLHALEDGVVPLELLFSGTVFYAGDDGRLQAVRLSWEQEAEYDLPVAVWREAMERHFPGTAWLRLRRDAFDRLCAYKSRHALATWEDAIAALLEGEPA